MPNWQDWKNKAVAAVNSAAREVDYQLAMNKLRLRVDQAQQETDRAFQDLGRQVYDAVQQHGTVDLHDADIAAALQGIEDSVHRLEAAKADLAAEGAKSTTLSCPACQTVLAEPVRFCPQCGRAVGDP
ncbi:MAG: zinc ribbon domain-containing protein [Thermaerobacter sp.]|nr:zinc ribbon domain-containing protein [Thermaerobacter sp.]